MKRKTNKNKGIPMTTKTRRQFLHTLASSTVFAAYPLKGFAQQTRVSTVAGTGVAGYEAEGPGGLPAAETPVNNPYGVVAGPDDALYFCEVDTGRIRRLDLNRNRLSTIAGNGEKGYVAESRRPLETAFSAPHEIRWDQQGNLYVVERDSHTVRRIAGRTGLVTTLAGNGEAGFSGDGGPGVLSQLRQPHSIAFDSQGNLLICDIGNSRLRLVDRETGFIRTVSGTGERLATPDSGPLEGTPLLGPRSIDTDPDGNAYLVLREGNAVFQLDIAANRLQRIAGTGERGYTGDKGSALAATFNGPKGIAYSRQDHSLYIVDTENHVIRRMSLASGLIDTVLGNGERGDGPDGDPLACKLNRPHGVCVHEGIVYVTDSESHRVRAITGLLA
jgi:DNA-binding beta-propeller fold protein YncE